MRKSKKKSEEVFSSEYSLQSKLHTEAVTRYARTDSAITLIALVITIIVLLILAGVSLSLIMGNDGILGRAENATIEHNIASIEEDIQLAIAELTLAYYDNEDVNAGEGLNEYVARKLNGHTTQNGAIIEIAEGEGEVELTYRSSGKITTGKFNTATSGVTISGVTSGGSGNTGGNGGTPTPEPEPEPTKYTVTYNANGGTGNVPASAEYAEGNSVTVDFATVPTKEGFTFLGWATTADAGTATYTSSGTTSFTMGTSNVTLYAVWEENILEVGDTVTYLPSGSYDWLATYATSDDSIEDMTLSSATGAAFNISSWKVFSVDKNTGKVELVPSAATTGTVKLQGAQGYNNAVKLLNDACSDLYGNESKGITARSINIDDLCPDGEDDFVEYHYKSQGNTLTNGTYLTQATSVYTEYKNYPAIYAQEELSVINGIKKSEGTILGRSEQSDFISRIASGATKGIISTATSVQPYHSYIEGDLTEFNLGEKNKTLLNAGNYWVASRCIVVGIVRLQLPRE